MREKVLQYIREQKLMRAGYRVGVAVSGGADSVALLRVLVELRDELGIVLAVAHFNHELRGDDSVADELFVSELAKEHGLEFFAESANVRNHAIAYKLSIEAAGRELRYRWFAQLAEEQRLDCVATAHTCDDQAETVLQKFLRGAGTKGLAGIFPSMAVGGEKNIRIVRPLLCVSREEIESYLQSLSQSWREDETNLDHRFLRNRVRHELLPLLEREYNPRVRQILCDVAEVARGEEEYWQREVLLKRADPDGRLSLEGFSQLPIALQRRLLKRFAEQHGLTLDFEHIEKLRRCALGEMTRAELPGGQIAARSGAWLQVCGPAPQPALTYEYVLPVPGEIRLLELKMTIRAEIVREQFARELASEELLNAERLGPELTVRNWRPGDRFWPEHSRSEEKLKRLFAEKHIPAEQRSTWPVAFLANVQNDVMSGAPGALAHVSKSVRHGALGEIVWVRGFPVAKAYCWKGSGDAVKIKAIRSRAED